MYNKIRELCSKLNVLSQEELHNNGIEAIIIYGINTQFNGFEFSKGDFPSVLSMLGSGLVNVSKTTGIPLKDLLDEIYENETKLEQMRKRGE